jgi:predicted nuclease of predicted toxin-antitoxin system
MKLYLDDDIASQRLAQILRAAGHDVQLPADVGLTGKPDAIHLAHACREQRACLSRNYADFEDLHDLVVAVNGQHAGILIVRRDNDPRRNLAPHAIVRAIAKLIAAQTPIENQYIIVNHWR